MRVTLSVTLNATGQIAGAFRGSGIDTLIYWASRGDSREGMVHMEIEGLAMGGATSPSNKQWSSSEVMEQINSTDVAIFYTGRKSVNEIRQSLG
jgi:hypothetical protein